MPTPQRQDQNVRRKVRRRRVVDPNATGANASGSPARAAGSKAAGSLDGTTASLGTVRRKRVRTRPSSSAVGYRSASKVAGKAGSVAPNHARRERRGFPVWGVVLIVLLAVGIGVGGFLLIRNLMPRSEGTSVEDGRQVSVVIPEGSTGNDIISILLDAGVIHSADSFRSAVKAQNADQSLRSGTYSFLTGSDPAEVVRQLVSGPNSSEGQLQLPEGLTMSQTAQIAEESLGIPADEFIEQAKVSNYVDDYPFLSDAGNDSLEGYLYPKTYDLAGKDVTADTVIRLMLTQYETEIESLDLEGARQAITKRYNLTPTNYDMLKIASIIEKEAISEDDRPKVSSVFYNRLSTGMALQSDATMGYVTGGAVSASDLETDSPYNTYLYKGLPPTPICSPSLWALQAAMDPADTPYYYFFIIEDGSYSNHTFSETYEEHDKAYAEALKEQAAEKGED